VARVVAIDPPGPDQKSQDALPESTAHLEVLETWKGEAYGRVEVSFIEHLTCPAPAVFLPGRTVLTFLVKNKQGAWSPLALSYGTLYPADDELPVLRDVARRFAMLRKGDELAYAALLVELACEPATRWDALFELAPEGDELHAYYARVESKGRRPRLSAAQLDRFAACFAEHPTGDQTLRMALQLLAGHPAPPFDRAVAGTIDALLALESPPWWTQQTVDDAIARSAFRPRPVSS
jgi:hypothetical protein